MSIPEQKSFKFVTAITCIMFSWLTYNAGATLNYWDPTGTTVSATPSGTWEGSVWAPTSALTATPIVFTEGVAAAFAAGTGATGSYTVTANADHSIAGIFNGGVGGDSTSSGLIINGGGILNIASGLQGFYVNTGGSTTILAQLSGTGEVENEGSGSLYFYASNTYSGGTLLGTSAGLNFNNNSAFGTGPINWSASPSVLGTPANDGHGNAGPTGPLTISNAVMTISGTQIFSGLTTVPVTFSGTWTLPATGTTVFQNQLVSGSGTPLVTISGAISGAAGFTKAGPGTLVLSGANSYSGGTTISSGVLSVTADNNLGTAPGSSTVNVTLSGGTFSASNTFTLNPKRQISLTANSTIGVSSNKTLTYAGLITGSAALSKSGTGTLVVSGANGYTGTTTISAGTFEADSQGGSAVGTNTVLLQSAVTLSGIGVVSGPVSGNGTIVPGAPASGPGTLTLGNGLDLSTGGTYTWKLASNSTAADFSEISLIGGNLNLGGSSKVSINFSGAASAPSTTNAFWQTQEAWTVISVNGSAGNSGSTKFASIVNGTYAAGNFTNYIFGNGNIVLLYQPNFTVLDTLYDAGPGFFSGENMILTNFSGLALYAWSATNAGLAVSNWTLIGQMQEQPLAPALPGYSRYSINVTPTASPTYVIAGNISTGPYLLSPVPAAILTTPDFSTFTVTGTNVSISTIGVLGLLPPAPIILPGSAYSGGGFQFQFSAATNQNYTVQASGDLITWRNIGSAAISSSPMTFVDPNATNYNRQFYRVVVP